MLIDNKKTREISWEDFKLEGNKENLIKQGWESFEPYGNEGEETRAPLEVFEENYAQNELLNGDFRKGEHHWLLRREGKFTFGENGVTIEYTGTMFNHIYQEFDVVEGDVYYCNVEYELNKKITMAMIGAKSNPQTNYPKGPAMEFGDKPGGNSASIRFVGDTNNKYIGIFTQTTEAQTGAILSIKNIYLVNLTDVFGKGKEPTQEWCDSNLKYYANWNDIPLKDKPVRAWDNMAVHFTPLGNGLTRIQTWGGSADMKLKSPNFGQLAETGTDMTISLYVENNSDSMIRFSNNLAIGGVPYPDGAEYMITVPSGYKGFAYLKGEKVDGTVELDIRSDGNIDIIVSQPEIIEGHNLNAMLLIEDLDDGRKHVQVHNVNENTKLVYTGGDVIKGEPYTLETEIENDGRIFNLSANMFDSVVEVQKGMNDIKKSGELQDKELKIEIGVD